MQKKKKDKYVAKSKQTIGQIFNFKIKKSKTNEAKVMTVWRVFTLGGDYL